MNIPLTITRTYHNCDFDFDVVVEFDYSPAHSGIREPGTGLLLSPDEPAELEIASVKDAVSGEDIELSPSEEEEAMERGWQQLRADQQAALEARAEDR